jgi:predicted membrane protein
MSTNRIIIGLIFILLGLGAFFRINVWSFIGPLILIIIGLKIISKDKNFKFETAKKVSSDSIDETVIFSSVSRKIESNDFEGGKFTTVFGEGRLDLTGIKSEVKEINMEVISVFGSVKIIVPKTWKVKSEGVGVFGGFENNAENQEKLVTLKIRGSAIFGSVEIFN